MPELPVPYLPEVLESFVCYRHPLWRPAHFEGFSHVCLKEGEHVTCECPCGKSWWPLPRGIILQVLKEQ